MTHAAELLAQAKALLAAADNTYRDSLLSLGRILHEFVLARIREGNGLSEEKRYWGGFTRAGAIRAAEKELSLPGYKISNLIATAMTVELLGGGLPLGGLAHRAIHFLAVMVRRRMDGQKHHPIGFDLTCGETWEICPGLEKSAPKIFARAVAECWTIKRAREEMESIGRKVERRGQRFFKPPDPEVVEAKANEPVGPRQERYQEQRYRHREQSERPTEAMATDQRKKAARVAAPKDVAEMCLDLVHEAEDPEAVIRHLQTMLAVFLAERKKNKRAWAV